MSAEFLSPLVVTHISSDRYPWRLEEPLLYYSVLPEIVAAFGTPVIQIPAGYQTDFASVPRLPVVHAATGGRGTRAAIVHDWLYDCHGTALDTGISRRTADRVFAEAMAADNDPRSAITRGLMYLGVRIGGWRGWNRDNRHKVRGLA